MRILQVYKGFFPPRVGGIEKHVALLSARLCGAADVRVLTSSSGMRTYEETAGHATVIRLGRVGTVAGVPVTPGLVLRLARERADIVHMHFPSPLGEIAWVLRRPSSARLVVTYHGDIVKQRRSLCWYEPFIRRFLGDADAIIVSSAAFLGSSTALIPFREKCEVIPLGIDPKQFEPTEQDLQGAARIRARFGTPLVLFVGRLVYYKGLPYLIEAMRHIDARLVIVGEGPLGSTLRAEVQQAGLQERVAFAGQASEDELRHFLHACDVFVLPSASRGEAFGIVQLEAMAASRPVISTKLDTGVPFVNVHGETGFVVPPGNALALAEALQTLIGNRDLCARMGAAGRTRVIERFSADIMVDRTLRLYRRVLNGLS